MSRTYEQRKRAEQQDETRQRIVRAAVDLHGILGPARTTVSAIAERAGVQRNTFYRHFPDDRSLILACSAMFTGDNPLPDPTAWEPTTDPAARTQLALGELYDYWERNETMVANVLRDAEISELVHEISSESWGADLERMRYVIASGWPTGRSSKRLIAAVDLAISFRTWQSLVRHSGLTTQQAADLMADVVAAGAEGIAHDS